MYGFEMWCDAEERAEALQTEVLIPAAEFSRQFTYSRTQGQLQRFQTRGLLLTCEVILGEPRKRWNFYVCILKVNINGTCFKVGKTEYADV